MTFSSVFMCFLQVFSDTYFKCFASLQTHIANVFLFGCLKSRSGVAARDPPAVAADVRSGEAED
jgi:hypothetical protein